MELGGPGLHAGGSERVEIAFTELAPILELDAQLEGAVDGPKEAILFEIEQGVIGLD